MNNDFLYSHSLLSVLIFLFVAVLSAFLIGIYFNRRAIRINPDVKRKGFGPLESSLFGLLALLMSFTFGMSESRYDQRRAIVIEEANNIGTAILRCDLLPDSVRNEVRNDFRKYLEARVEYFDAGYNLEKISVANKKTEQYYLTIWKKVTDYSKTQNNLLMINQIIPALNNMIDITTTREASRIEHIPESIIWLLLLLCTSSSFLVGYSSKDNKTNHTVFAIFLLMTFLALFTILDLDKPRSGIITIDNENQKIVELKSLLKD